MSRIPQPSKKTVKKVSAQLITPDKTPDEQLAVVYPKDGGSQRPSILQKKVFTDALGKSALDPKQKVKTMGSRQSQVRTPSVTTKRGEEKVLQQFTMEQTVQRSPRGEYVAKTLRGVDAINPQVARQIEITCQQIDPTHATESAGINEAVSVSSSLSVTSEGTHLKKSYKKKSVINKKTAEKVNMNPQHVNRLVKEETEDVENTLKMVPPELITSSVVKYPLKKKVQSLRLSADPVSLLAQTVIVPTPTADEVDTESSPPEVMATVMSAVEHGATPDSAPTQIFNTLFPDVKGNKINISSVAPGPLGDIIVPQSQTPKINQELLSSEMEESLLEIQHVQELPKENICTENKIASPQRASKAENKTPTLLDEEVPPWETQDVQKIAALVGGEPAETVEAVDISNLSGAADISQELSGGIDYFVDADVVPYETKVQIRGSKLPNWFPGYMAALPHLPELMRISKNPSEVLHSAWKAVQPKIFPEDSLVIA